MKPKWYERATAQAAVLAGTISVLLTTLVNPSIYYSTPKQSTFLEVELAEAIVKFHHADNHPKHSPWKEYETAAQLITHFSIELCSPQNARHRIWNIRNKPKVSMEGLFLELNNLSPEDAINWQRSRLLMLIRKDIPNQLTNPIDCRIKVADSLAESLLS